MDKHDNILLILVIVACVSLVIIAVVVSVSVLVVHKQKTKTKLVNTVVLRGAPFISTFKYNMHHVRKRHLNMSIKSFDSFRWKMAETKMCLFCEKFHVFQKWRRS